MTTAKILVADDDAKIVKFLTGLLERENYAVFVAKDGEEALAQFKKVQPDLILLDVMMPKMDGYEVCRQIREESNVPVIFLSAKSTTMDKIMGLTLGSDDYLT